MNVNEVIEKMIGASGKSKAEVSREMGRHRNFISSSQNQKNVPVLTTLAEIADATGFEIVIEGNGEKFTIDPPEKNESKNENQNDVDGTVSENDEK